MKLARLITGLVVAGFVIGHFLNHALGVVSIEAMDRMRVFLAAWWRSPVGSVLLYGSLLVHFALALVSLYRRTTLRMPLWEALQLGFGLAVPPLLIAHIVGTRGAWMLLGHNVDYERVVGVLWSNQWTTTKQIALLLLVWAHVWIGLHYWLRLRSWYRDFQPLVFALALLVPALALAGFASAGFYLWPSIEVVGGINRYNLDLAGMTPQDRALLGAWGSGLEYGFWCALGATLLARWLRTRIGATYRVRHASGRVITAPVGRSILEAIRDEGVPHASVCGGRARCTTCRVRIGEGLEKLPPPGRQEARALASIDAPRNVRLACQCRPTADVGVTPLLPANAGPRQAAGQRGAQGRERSIVAMFVDLRDSVRLAEGLLPYDTVFLMNQFFAEMYEALEKTRGYYAQFRGDGLLALYGLETPLPDACRAALAGAADMQARIERLNQSLSADLVKEPLRIGIGVHAGVAIVGTMGPPDAPIYSAIGDMVNTAARLENMTKAYACTLVVSTEVLRQAGVDPGDAPLHQVRVRGREERINVHAVDDPRKLVQQSIKIS